MKKFNEARVNGGSNYDSLKEGTGSSSQSYLLPLGKEAEVVVSSNLLVVPAGNVPATRWTWLI